MKKLFSIAVLGLILSSCVKGFDGIEPEPTPNPTPTSNKATQEEINANVAKVFGTTFSPNQDWSSTTKHSITITANAPLSDIEKVQILTEAPYMNEAARVLNEATVSKGQSVSITYDCPSEYTDLVAACVDSKGIYYVAGFKAGDNSISFQKPAQARTRAAIDLPELPAASGLKMKYKNSYLTYNAMRTIKANEGETFDPDKKECDFSMWKDTNWEKERIWMLDKAGGNSTWTVDKSTIFRKVSMTPEEKAGLETVFAVLGGKEANNDEHKKINLNLIRESPVYKLTDNYLVSDGIHPITVTPVLILSKEAVNTALYYYYYNPSDLEGKNEIEKSTFLKNLPKFKCVDSKQTMTAGGVNEKTKTEFFKAHEYVLPYFGNVTSDMTGDVTAKGFIFPKDTRIGFMFRKCVNDWKDTYTTDNEFYPGATNYSLKSYNKTDNGEVYADGHLNKQINHYGSFAHAMEKGLGEEDPRAAIFGANQRAYMMFEEGADVNFADIIFEIQGGLVEVDAAQEINNNVYTFCFEDRNLGDYDMNDVVIKAERLNISQVKYTVVACGAYDELYLRNINGQTLNTTTEIHALFGVNNLSTFINTQTKNYEPVSEVITVDPSFSFTDFSKQVYIYNKTQDYDVKMSQKGEDPHAIMIPSDFAYPKEKVCIKDAYKQFNSWGEDPISSTDWYLHPEDGKVMNAFKE